MLEVIAVGTKNGEEVEEGEEKGRNDRKMIKSIIMLLLLFFFY